jgi:hypothetical protein
MRFLPTCAVLLSFCAAVPAFSQNPVLVAGAAAAPANTTVSAPSATALTPTPGTPAPAVQQGPIDLTEFKATMEKKK